MVKYAKKSYRKRARRPRARPYAKRTSSIARVVKKVLSRNLERKTWLSYNSNSNLATASTTVAPAVSDLLPQILQGTGASQRIGNEVKITKAFIRGYVNLRPYDATLNPLPVPIYVKMWLVSYKLTNQPSFTTAALFSNFFQTNNSSVGFQANMLDTILEVNKEAWTVHKTKIVKIGTSSANSLNLPTNYAGYMDNSPMSAPFYFEFAKHLDKLKYDDTVNNLCTNRNLFIIYQAVNANGETSTYIPAEIHASKVIHYTDA